MSNEIVKVGPWPGGDFPVHTITKGYMRLATAVNTSGNGTCAIAFSSIPVEETDMDYKEKDGEVITPLFALGMKEPEAAELLAKVFSNLAKDMREVYEKNGTDDSGNEP